MITAGVDYSFTSPAMVIHDGRDFFYYYMTTLKSRLYNTNMLHSELIEYDATVDNDIKDEKIGSSMARFEKIAEYFFETILEREVEHVFLEGYALGAKGKVFSIAENTAIFKYMLYDHDIPVTIIPPTKVKKLATGKGNANKDLMKEAYESNVNPTHLRPISHYVSSPYTDCVDAYWILYAGLTQKAFL